MSDLLKAVIQDLINDRTEQAEVAVHQYIVARTQGLMSENALDGFDLDKKARKVVLKMAQKLQKLGLDPSVSDLNVLFIGGGDIKDKDLLGELSSIGYDSAGGWAENKDFFQKLDVSKEDYDVLVAASE